MSDAASPPLLRRLHGRLVHSRRVEVLARHIAPLIPDHASVLDVGAGDGQLGAAIARIKPGVPIKGIDVVLRNRMLIPVELFDGTTIPFADGSVDVVLLVDVLHHTADPSVLLRESRRVARTAVVVKDHVADGVFDRLTLRAMDWAGNAGQGVALPYNYWTSRDWDTALRNVGLTPELRVNRLHLYPWAVEWLFERSLHFVVRLRAT